MIFVLDERKKLDLTIQKGKILKLNLGIRRLYKIENGSKNIILFALFYQNICCCDYDDNIFDGNHFNSIYFKIPNSKLT